MAKVKDDVIHPDEIVSQSRVAREHPTDDPPEKNIEQIAKTAKRKKQPVAKRFANTFFAEQATNVGDYVAQEIVVPTIKGMILDVITGIGNAVADGVEYKLFGTTSGRGRMYSRGPVSMGARRYVDYSGASVSRAPAGGGYYGDSNARRQSYNSAQIDQVIFDDPNEAEDVLTKLCEVVDMYGYATVSDLYSLLGWGTTAVDHDWGWNNLSTATKKRGKEGYYLSLPNPKPVNQMR